MTTTKGHEVPVQELDRVTIRFAGDSGDGMQLTGTQFTRTAAVFGNDISTLPDYPAEIRAPAGSLPGVSGFQISFSSSDIHTPGDAPDVLVAMNPAALRTNVGGPASRAARSSSTATPSRPPTWPRRATRPTRWPTARSRPTSVFEIPVSTLNARALEGLDMTAKAGRPDEELLRPRGHVLALRAEHGADAPLDRGEVRNPPRRRRGEPAGAQRRLRLRRDDGDLPHPLRRPGRPTSPRAPTATSPATRRPPSAASRPRHLAGRPLFYASYPITPASDILHQLSELQELRAQDIPGRGRDRRDRRRARARRTAARSG